jgi:hypothetical protein
MSVLWRKRQRTHLEIVSSHELFARRLPSSADTLHSVSTSRRCSSGALLQLQVQLTALAVLQLQRADTPEFVSACSGGLQRALSRTWSELQLGDAKQVYLTTRLGEAHTPTARCDRR